MEENPSTSKEKAGGEVDAGDETTPPPPLTSAGSDPPVSSSHDDQKYAYFNKGYTSEIFKIQLNNIPERIGYQVDRVV